MVSESFNLSSLRTIPMFSSLSDDELEILRPGLTVATFSLGETIMEEGKPGGRLYVLLAGQVKVVACHRLEEETVLHVMEPVEVFGEMSLLTDEPVSATIIATDYCHMLTLERDALEPILLKNPNVCVSLLRDAFRRIRRLTHEIVRDS